MQQLVGLSVGYSSSIRGIEQKVTGTKIKFIKELNLVSQVRCQN